MMERLFTVKQQVGEKNTIPGSTGKTDSIQELFTDENSGLGLDDGLEILECAGLSMEKDGNSIDTADLGRRCSGLKTFIKKRRKGCQ